ncbi:hypothetical protein F4861DRAFT_137875 [Xylaria intraflava]|nr:hypothetical protein F4861DRAFT_137875 [Xylaria intraflava]
MALNRRRESEIRLEALGHLSDYYSDLAKTNIRSGFEAIDPDDPSQWEAISDNSDASTSAVVFDKPPPPGFFIRGRTTSDSVKPNLSSEGSVLNSTEAHATPMDVSPRHEPSSAHAESNLPHNFNITQLRPAKYLHRTQHPATLNTGGFRHALGQSSSDNASRGHELPVDMLADEEEHVQFHHSAILPPSHALPPTVVNNFGDGANLRYLDSSCIRPQIPAYAQKPTAECPVSTYVPYRPQPPEPSPGLPVRSGRSVSFSESGFYKTESPASYHDGHGRDNEGPGSNHGAAQHSHNSITQTTPIASARNPHSSGSSRVGDRMSAQYQARHPPSRTTTRVDGIDFEMLSPVNPISPPLPTPTTSSGSQPSTASVSPLSPKRKSAYGAWESDRPRQKRASFLERAQERLDRSVQEQLVKVGQRPPPSFKVNSVVRSSDSTCQGAAQRMSQDRSRDNSIKTEPTYRDASTQTKRPLPSKTSAALARFLDWEISASSESDDDVAAALLYLVERRRARDSAPEIPRSADLAPPAGFVELEAPVPVELPVEKGEEGEGASSSDDSLFLGSGNPGMRHPADYSFFSSEYAQRSAAALMREQQRRRHPVTEPSWRHMPHSLPSASLPPRNGDDERRPAGWI